MKKISMLALLAIPLMAGSLLAPQIARATTALTCVVDHGKNVQDIAPISLHAQVSCDWTTGNARATGAQVQVIDGMGNIRSDQFFAGKSGQVDFTTTNAGTWHVSVTWFGKGGIEGKEVIDIEVSFLVLPESPIGTVAMIGSSMAAMGAFLGLKRFKQKI